MPPINDSPDLEQSWGEWSGLPFVDGTYSASIWGRKNTILALRNEVQTYNGIGEASTFNLLFGAATTVDPYHAIPTWDNCNACHTPSGCSLAATAATSTPACSATAWSVRGHRSTGRRSRRSRRRE